MLEYLLLHLLKAKIGLVAAAKIPVIATLLVLGTTGFVVTGTIQGDEDETMVNLTVKPLETKKCLDALIAQTATLLQLDVLAADATAQLRRMRERAAKDADRQNKDLGEDALMAQFNASSTQLREALAAARREVLATADLDKCQDGNPGTTVDLDVALLLREKYDKILRDFGPKVNNVLKGAKPKFDSLVANAPAKPQQAADDGDDSQDSGDSLGD